MSFNDVLPYWKNELWPNRKTVILPYNIMTYLSGYDKEIQNFSNPVFWTLSLENEVIGVNSGLSTSATDFRNRGLWIKEEHRGSSLSSLLFQVSQNEASKRNHKIIWSLPRKTSLQSYLNFGFVQTSDWRDDLEFGPNCFVKKDIDL